MAASSDVLLCNPNPRFVDVVVYFNGMDALMPKKTAKSKVERKLDLLFLTLLYVANHLLDENEMKLLDVELAELNAEYNDKVTTAEIHAAKRSAS